MDHFDSYDSSVRILGMTHHSGADAAVLANTNKNDS